MAIDSVLHKLLTLTNLIEASYLYYLPAFNRLKFVDDSDKVPTAAVSSDMVVHYNRKFIEGLHQDECRAVMLHELLHYMHDHHTRYNINPYKWVPYDIHNIAMDLEINEHIEGLPEGSCIASEMGLPSKLSYEEYLAILISKMNKGCGAGETGSSKGDDFIQKLRNQFSSNKSTGVDVDMTNYDPVTDSSVLEQVRRECDRKIAESKKAGNSTYSNEIIRKIHKQPYDWYVILKNLLARTITNKKWGYEYRTYSIPNRRLALLSDGILFPTSFDYEYIINVIIILDISGSMGSLVNTMYGMLRNINDHKVKCKITVLETNTDVAHVVDDFDTERSEFKSQDSGGTDMRKGWQWILDNKLEHSTDLVVCMTDGETPWPNPEIMLKKSVILTTHDEPMCGKYEWHKISVDSLIQKDMARKGITIAS